MERFIRMAFWIVTLSCFLSAKSLPINQVNQFNSTIDLILGKFTCEDSAFYTPRDVEDRCIAAALKCFKKELHGTFREECNGPMYFIDQLNDILNHTLKSEDLGNSSECVCEHWPTAPFRQFLGAMGHVLEQYHTKVLVQTGANTGAN